MRTKELITGGMHSEEIIRLLEIDFLQKQHKKILSRCEWMCYFTFEKNITSSRRMI